MDKNIMNRNALRAQHTVEAMKKRQFDSYYCETKEDAAAKVLELIGTEDVVSWGGSVSIDELGVKKMLEDRGQKMINRDLAKTPEEKGELMRQALLCDTFLMSANGVSEDGVLINIDGNGNRVAALCYGPKSVIVVVGVNKLMSDEDAALDRARNVAAPINHQRFAGSTPCLVNGCCGNCIKGTICAQIIHTRYSMTPGRIKVIIVNEELGY